MGEPRELAHPSPLYIVVPLCLVLHPIPSHLSYLERGSDSGAAYEERTLYSVSTPPCFRIHFPTSAALLDLEPGGRLPHRTCAETARHHRVGAWSFFRYTTLRSATSSSSATSRCRRNRSFDRRRLRSTRVCIPFSSVLIYLHRIDLG